MRGVILQVQVQTLFTIHAFWGVGAASLAANAALNCMYPQPKINQLAQVEMGMFSSR